MALVLGGYRADKAELTGSQWLKNTVTLATTNGLTKDVNFRNRGRLHPSGRGADSGQRPLDDCCSVV